MGYSREIGICACVTLILVIVIIVIAIPASLSTVEQREYVVIHNTYNGHLHEPMTQGKYVKWAWYEEISFERISMGKNYNDLTCWSEDMVKISFPVSILYQYDEQSLVDTQLKKYGNEAKFDHFFDNFIRDVVITQCSHHTSIQYYIDRSGIDIDIFKNITEKIKKIDGFGATVSTFQLLNVALPNELVHTIGQKQTTEQEIIIAQNNRSIEIALAETLYQSAIQHAETIKVIANTTAMTNILRAEQQSSIEMSKWNNTGNALKYIKDTLQLNETQLLSYIQNDIIRRTKNVYIGFN